MQSTDIQAALGGLREVDVYLSLHQKALRVRLLATYEFQPALRYQPLSLPRIKPQTLRAKVVVKDFTKIINQERQ